MYVINNRIICTLTYFSRQHQLQLKTITRDTL